MHHLQACENLSHTAKDCADQRTAFETCAGCAEKYLGIDMLQLHRRVLLNAWQGKAPHALRWCGSLRGADVAETLRDPWPSLEPMTALLLVQKTRLRVLLSGCSSIRSQCSCTTMYPNLCLCSGCLSWIERRPACRCLRSPPLPLNDPCLEKRGQCVFLIVLAVHFCSKWLLCCLEAQDPGPLSENVFSLGPMQLACTWVDGSVLRW